MIWQREQLETEMIPMATTLFLFHFWFLFRGFPRWECSRGVLRIKVFDSWSSKCTSALLYCEPGSNLVLLSSFLLLFLLLFLLFLSLPPSLFLFLSLILFCMCMCTSCARMFACCSWATVQNFLNTNFSKWILTIFSKDRYITASGIYMGNVRLIQLLKTNLCNSPE